MEAPLSEAMAQQGAVTPWMGGLLKHFHDMTMPCKLKCIGGYINIQFRNQTYGVYQDE